MKQLLLLTIILLSCKPKISSTNNVLICNSKTAKSYHLNYCMGLKECNHDIEELTVQQAIKKGRKACNFCYKNQIKE